MVPNAITYSALISVCEKGQQPEQALDVFVAMHQQGVVPDAITYSTLAELGVKRSGWHALTPVTHHVGPQAGAARVGARRLVGVPAEGLRLGHLAGSRPVSEMASGGPGFGGWVGAPHFPQREVQGQTPDLGGFARMGRVRSGPRPGRVCPNGVGLREPSSPKRLCSPAGRYGR